MSPRLASLTQLKLTLALLALAQLSWLVYVINRTSAKPESPPVAAAHTPPWQPRPPPPTSPPPPPLTPPPATVDQAPSALEQRVLKVCGTAWQAAYSSAHAAWSQDGHTTRALVFEVRGTSGGLADRLTGMMTALLLAILTDRAFQLDWPEHTVALQTPRIDSTGLLPALGRTPPAEVRRVTWINGDRIKLAQLTAELDHLWPERVVRLQSNRGFTQALLEQHAAAARRQLTRNSTQFGCLLNFLFEPTPATLGPYTALIARLSDATRPVVAVHVRTGDRAFDVTTAASLQAPAAVTTCCILLTTYYLPLTAYYSLLTTGCLLAAGAGRSGAGGARAGAVRGAPLYPRLCAAPRRRALAAGALAAAERQRRATPRRRATAGRDRAQPAGCRPYHRPHRARWRARRAPQLGGRALALLGSDGVRLLIALGLVPFKFPRGS